MSDYKFDTNYLEVGDSMEGSPIEQSYFISAVMAAGGEIEIDGNTVTILQLPKKELKAQVYVKPVIDPPVKEELVIEPPTMLIKPLSIVEEAPLEKEAPAPVVRTRKPKITSAPDTVKE